MKPEHESSLKRIIADIDAAVHPDRMSLSEAMEFVDALIEDLKARFDAYEEEG